MPAIPDQRAALRPRLRYWWTAILNRIRSRTPRRRSLRNEWLMLSALTVAAALLLGSSNSLQVPDRLIYDHLMDSLQRPAPDNIVMITIDDKSLAELGRWPWKRGTHAQLLNVLSNGAPKAIGLDLILTEGDTITASGDHALALALARNRRTVLPILIVTTEAGAAPLLPDGEFAAAAAGLAHIQLNFGDDGVVRSANLHETLGQRTWKSLALALLEDVGRPAQPLPSYAGDKLMRIPFLGPPGHFTRVSYIDVLRGTVPAHFFRDKYVLVGASASGLGDLFPVPQANAQGMMSGVELHANILASLIEGRSIHLAAPASVIIFTALPALLMLVGFLYLSPRYALALTACFTLLIAAITYFSFQHDVWLAPSGALLLLWLVYPLWSWRRLEVALRYLKEETDRLAATAPFAVNPTNNRRGWDFLERRIEATRSAARRMLDLHQFVSDNLNSMPDANLVINQSGDLMLFNRKAQQLFASFDAHLERGLHIQSLLPHFHPVDHGSVALHWQQLLPPPATASATSHTGGDIEARDTLQRIFLIRATPSQQPDGVMLGWIVSFADVTALRATERLRDDSLNFISHDMRAPQSSILATLALQRSGKIALDQEALFKRIEKSVHSTLSLAEDFILLARAESRNWQMEELDFSSLLADAADDMWMLANDKRILIDISVGEPAWVHGDRTMLVRALGNLLSNAIKYGPADSGVECLVETVAAATPDDMPRVRCSIRDHGPGLSAIDLGSLFTPFYRSGITKQIGIGLGLTLVQTVIRHHGGTITVANADTGGACFTVELPAAI